MYDSPESHDTQSINGQRESTPFQWTRFISKQFEVEESGKDK